MTNDQYVPKPETIRIPPRDGYAGIECQSEITVTGRRIYYGYKWLGSPLQPARIDRRIIRQMDDSGYPWPLVKIDDDYAMGGCNPVFARRDVGFGAAAACLRAGFALKRATMRFRCRLLCTAEIWGLTERPINCIPSWYFLKPVQWFVRRRAAAASKAKA